MAPNRLARLAVVVVLGVATLLTGVGTASATPDANDELKIAVAEAVNTFRNQETGRCIDDSNAHGLRAFGCNNLDFQRFQVTVWKDKTREFKNLNTNRCIDDSAAHGLRAFGCNKSRFQSWWVTRWKDGTLEFRNQETGRCIDDSHPHGLRAFGCNKSRFQSWS
ncbi:RICIN domain-containing protein [Streptoalloteichus hindustanus]|uniref:Uncharacterized protein n=1 Tax=Streptoalloteichus hindustanus TaxID=2017 RepID=A0A1M5MVV7_STRHI|nr:RICIN domain-containing protein [Streptoalloteichus hindustanus]SHG81355.1 hypothetical protein SAMN05444320_11470 [Streptoalloteichus hindustanus]